jgi:hypothetical protein
MRMKESALREGATLERASYEILPSSDSRLHDQMGHFFLFTSFGVEVEQR